MDDESDTPLDEDAVPAGARLAQSFVHGNGQEHRQMFHGAPPGYVQPIWSPAHFVVTPMQISTNHGLDAPGGGPLPGIKRPGGATPAPPSSPGRVGAAAVILASRAGPPKHIPHGCATAVTARNGRHFAG